MIRDRLDKIEERLKQSKEVKEIKEIDKTVLLNLVATLRVEIANLSINYRAQRCFNFFDGG